jgi:hypothetical protein
MSIVAVIEAKGHQGPISDAAWEALIEGHPQLAFPPARQGINPFTKQPIVLPPARGCARVMEAGAQIGTIERPQDGSECLLVRCQDSLKANDPLLAIANDVANRLGVTCDAHHDLVRLSREPPLTQPEDPASRTKRLWASGDREGAVACYMSACNVSLAEAMRAVTKLVGSGG